MPKKEDGRERTQTHKEYNIKEIKEGEETWKQQNGQEGRRKSVTKENYGKYDEERVRKCKIRRGSQRKDAGNYTKDYTEAKQ